MKALREEMYSISLNNILKAWHQCVEEIPLLQVLLQEQFSTLCFYGHLQEDHESYLCIPSVPSSFFSIVTLLQNILLDLSSPSYQCQLLREGTCPFATLCYSPLRNPSSGGPDPHRTCTVLS